MSSPSAHASPSASPGSTRKAAILNTSVAKEDFKTWFFQTAAQQQQHQQQNSAEASGAQSPRTLRRLLRRAWKALERSPYYKTLRSEHAGAGSLSDLGLLEAGHHRPSNSSRSAPGSPGTKHRSKFKKSQKSRQQQNRVLKQRNSEHELFNSAENNQTVDSPEQAVKGVKFMMRLSTATAASHRVRPFSAGSVGSTSSSEGSESGATTGGDDKKLISPSKRNSVMPAPAKGGMARPKSSGILKQPPPPPITPQSDSVDASSRNVMFTSIDETQSSSSQAAALSVKRLSSASSRRSGDGGDSSDTNSVNMVIDSSNANADTAQLVTIHEEKSSKRGLKGAAPSSAKSSSSEGGAKPFAALKIVDETKTKGSSSKPAADLAANKSAASAGTSVKKASITSVVAPAASATTTPTTSAPLMNATPAQLGSGQTAAALLMKKAAPVADPSAKLMSILGGSKEKAAEASHQNQAASVAGSGGSNPSLAQSAVPATAAAPGKSNIFSAAGLSIASSAAKEASTKDPTATFSTQDSASAEAGGTTDGTESGKQSSRGGSVKEPSSKSGSLKKNEPAAKEAGKKDEAKKDDKKGKKADKDKEADKKGDAKADTKAAGDAAATGATDKEKEAAAGAAAPTDPNDPKSHLKREMSRISVKTNESRKSIDMSKHIMNLIHGGQAQEEQTKKPQTTNQSYIQQAIPALPMAAAVICLIFNLLAPGVGTMLSGILNICIGKPRIEAKENTIALTIFVNCFVGMSQLMTVTFFFVGWFWSMVWGINMIINSVEYHAELRAEREKELQQTAMRAFGFIRADAPTQAVDE